MSSKHLQIGGNHYKNKEIQPWDLMEDWFTHEEFMAYLRGNVIKYIARYKEKNGEQDLHKARHYLDKMIDTMRGDTNGR